MLLHSSNKWTTSLLRTTNPTNILFFLNQQKYYHKKNYGKIG